MPPRWALRSTDRHDHHLERLARFASSFPQAHAAHTSDQSLLLFPGPFDQVVAAHSGFRDRWAVRLTDDATELTVSASGEFFDALYDELVALPVAAGRAG